MTVFFIPYGLITAELGAAWPGEGGVYIWVREAFGPTWGSIAAWMYWINNAYWIPSVYLIFAGTFGQMFLKTHSPWQDAGIAIALTWLTVAIGIVRLEISKWVPNLGAVIKALIFLALGVLGLSALFRRRPAANAFSPRALLPHWNDSLAYLPALLYSTFGFELMSSAGAEMRDPRRDVPRVILWSGALIAVLYSFAIGGILFAVPMGKLSIVTGTWDALAILGKQWGRAGDTVVFLLGLGFLYACIANVVTWSLGANRVAAVAAEEGVLPEALGRLHPRFKTPAFAFVVMGFVATAPPRGRRAPLEQPVEHLLDDVPPDGALPPAVLPARLPRVHRAPQAPAEPAPARTGCPAARRPPRSRRGSARSTSSARASSSSCRRRRARRR